MDSRHRMAEGNCERRVESAASLSAIDQQKSASQSRGREQMGKAKAAAAATGHSEEWWAVKWEEGFLQRYGGVAMLFRTPDSAERFRVKWNMPGRVVRVLVSEVEQPTRKEA